MANLIEGNRVGDILSGAAAVSPDKTGWIYQGREISFKELLHRGKLNQADSNVLKVYAVNKGNLYGKDIQCEAIKNLAERTAKGNKRNT